MATTKNKDNSAVNKKSNENGKVGKKFSIGTILNSSVFATVMKIAEKISYSKSRVFRLLTHAFEKLKEESNQKRIQEDAKHQINTLMRMMKAYYRGDYKKIPGNAIVRILGGLIYFVWILDLIPDFIPIVGFADDVAVIIWVYSGLVNEIEDFERWESVTAMNIDPAENGSVQNSNIESTTIKHN
jgi:uncharacterized membrane protein YkvA (DUF1232 family)